MVNVSARQLAERDFVDDVRQALQGAGLAAERLVLEITESVLMQDRDAMLVRLQQIKHIGVKVAVDDFGTGFSSLAYLQHYPVDVLKIDKSFVDTVQRGDKHAAITRTVIGLADALHMRSVAEGVEHEDQRAELLRLGCRYAKATCSPVQWRLTRCTHGCTALAAGPMRPRLQHSSRDGHWSRAGGSRSPARQAKLERRYVPRP